MIQKRSFQPGWFDKWPWLHYIEQSDTVFCFTCKEASEECKLQWSLNTDPAFITTGFSNWKDACSKFNSHQKSKTHEEAVPKVLTVPATMQDIGIQLVSQMESERADNRHCFLKIISALKFLAQQGIAIRGHDNKESNFYQLLQLLAHEDDKLKQWLQRKKNKYCSGDIQNEI